jgi:F-type H+-transporting ATPase subunit alpha
MGTLDDGVTRPLANALERTLADRPDPLDVSDLGVVVEVGPGIAEVAGLDDVAADELLLFPRGLLGIASEITEERTGVILLGDETGLVAGAEVRRTGRVVDAPVGEALLGRVVDGLGRPLDDRGPIRTRERRPIERPAPAILDRAAVTRPLQTGIKVVDAAIPIGRGQRELVIGDRQTGKTSLALSAILNQHDTDAVGIYCAVGQRASSVAKVIGRLREAGVSERAIVVVAAGEDAPGLQFVAPYAATAMAEAFMDQGRSVVIIYDDLTKHARAYRELSLLLRRPPGREAYPGDIFYIHARLLERSTHLRDELGGGSLTALPIIETEARNISAYIPTNLISITDGQIYLSPDLFQKGNLPAVDIGMSVSRVGGQAQLPAFHAVAGDLRLSYAQFEELESFARFGTRLDEKTRRTLERGWRVRAVLGQGEAELLSVADQVAVLLAAVEGALDSVALDDIRAAESAILKATRAELPELCGRIEAGERLENEDRASLVEVAAKALNAAGLVKSKGADGDA